MSEILGGGGGGAGTPGDTVATETSFGQSSSAGASSDYSRKDHTHGTPAKQITVSADEPADPQNGDLWVDIS